MGAQFIDMTLKTTNKKEIEEKFKERQEQDIWEHGHDAYNGTFSTVDYVKIIDRTFSNRDEAEEFCIDNAEKWTYAVAVKIQEDDKEPYTYIGAWAAI